MMGLYYINGGETQENVREVELIVLRNYRDQGKEKKLQGPREGEEKDDI